MVETYRRKVQTKDPPLQTYVQAIKPVGDWIIEGYKAKIVPPSASADGLVIRDYGDTTDRIKLIEDGKVQAINLEAIGGQTKIVPPSAGADALVVRDAEDTEDRAIITEDGNITISGHFFPKVTATRDVGTLTYNWRTLYIRNIHSAAPVINVGKDLIPLADDIRSLGSSTNRWLNLYLSNAIRPAASAIDYYLLQSHNGTAYVDCAKLIGGYLEIAKGKLTGNLEIKSFDPGTTVTIDAGLTYTIPNGVYYVFLGTNTSAEAYDDVAAAWKTVIAAGGSGLVISDGTNVRLYNAAAVAESSNLRRVF